MKFALKLGIGCAAALLFFVLVGFVAFPHLIKSKIKKMVQLQPGLEIRDMFTNVPFGLTFNVYMFNVTNPMEVQEGKKPILNEVGPFCYSEWKKKVDIEDNDAEDVMFYKAADTFYKNPGPGCAPYDALVTIPHPLIVGMVNTVMRQKPGAIGLISKAIKSIYQNPTSIYLTAKAGDILFDGVIINCGVKDFAGKAICTQLKETPELKHVNDDDLAFSLMGPKNGTPSKVFKVMRGAKDFHKVGWILEYDEKKEMEIWPTKECNQLKGTDGTIFPPFLKKEEGLVSYAPDLCRSLAGEYSKNTKYDGIPVRLYTASLGDMSTDPDLKCYCPTPETCLKKGLMDLYLCAGMPIIVSLPHFYDSDKSLLNDVEGLNPNEEDHGIRIYFESMTGGPVSARKRLMFSFPLEPNPKVPVFEKLPQIYHPIFWVEEGVDLNRTFTQPIKTLFTMKKAVKITSWVVVAASLVGIGASGYLFLKQTDSMDVTSIPKVNPSEAIKKAAETMKTFKANHNVSQVNHADSADNEVGKY